MTKKSKDKLFLSFLVTLSLFLVSACFSIKAKAFSAVDNQTVDSNKVWIIKFNQNVLFNDATKSP